MTPLWRKHLFKAADLVVVLPPGHVAWPVEMSEPLTCLIARGSSNAAKSYWGWEGLCRKCGKPTMVPKDLFCSNFGSFRPGWRTCRRSWHARCYEARPNLTFHIAQPENDEGGKWKKKRYKRFLVARNGIIYLATFSTFPNLLNCRP